VLVLDRDLQVRAANPAARALLGELDPVADAPFSLLAERAWAPLAQAVTEAWVESPAAPRRDVTLGFVHAPARALRLRPRWMNAEGQTDPLLVLLLEDRAKLQARARQEKLAAMGRMSAGIAHEIRNPLSAISQANALLAEDLAGNPGGERLTALVASNVKRLQRIVDEVMLLAAPAEQAPTPMDAAAGLRETLQDWIRTQPAAVVQSALPMSGLPVLFEPEHLRRVLVNLLDNGWRHAQSQPHPWVRVELQALDAERAMLRVVNPSPPLPAHIEQHLFEPFHSTRSRSSGLGLYICRELCERYGARIEYQALETEGERAVCFSVTLRRTA
jgi:two-component system sensor histidine kinase PilS (NtrC family)